MGRDQRDHTALREVAEEAFQCPPGDLPLDLHFHHIGERPGTDEMSHLIVWAAQWPEDVAYRFAEPDGVETLDIGLFDLDDLPQPLAYPYQVDFIQLAAPVFGI